MIRLDRFQIEFPFIHIFLSTLPILAMEWNKTFLSLFLGQSESKAIPMAHMVTSVLHSCSGLPTVKFESILL